MTTACEQCGSTSWETEDLGSQSLQVCTECGHCVDHVAFCVEEGRSQEGTGSQIAYADGPSSQGKFHAPRNLELQKERRFVKEIRDAASTVHLNKQSTDVCVAAGKSLVQRKANLGHSVKKFAVGLVFMELKRTTPTASYQKIADEFKMKKTILGRTVKKLEKMGVSLANTDTPLARVPFEDRLNVSLDKLATNLSLEERRETRKMAMDLKEVCSDVPLKGNLMLDTESSDVAFFTLARQVLDDSSDEQAILSDIAQESGLYLPTLRNRVYQIRAILLRLAKECPALGHVEGLNVRVIQRYIPTIVQNKAFLTTGPERFKESGGDDGQDEATPLLPLPPVPEGREAEEEGELSDLDPDIEEYIATQTEVEQKKLASQDQALL